jgi:glucokinase
VILGGDLGGTKTLLALAEHVDGRIEIIREQRFSSRITAVLTTCLRVSG